MIINKQNAPRNRTITLSNADISRLKERLIKLDKPVSLSEYVCDDKTMIESFLVSNPSIEKYLKEAPTQIKKYFKNSKLSLVVSIDPEVDDDPGILFVDIATNESVEISWLKLNDLTREWIVPVVGQDASKFNVDINFA